MLFSLKYPIVKSVEACCGIDHYTHLNDSQIKAIQIKY